MIEENNEKEENNRKRIARLEADLNALKATGLNPVEEPDQSMATTGMSGLVDADELTRMIKKIEASLTRTITQVGGLSEKAEELETEVEKLKRDKRKSSTAVTGGSNCTQDEIDKWNAWVNKHNYLEEKFNKLLTEWENHDGPKVKNDLI